MSRLLLHRLRRCRVLFALALCAWLGLASTVFAKTDCCAGMTGMATMMHHHAAPAPLHADGAHADCTCAHMTAALPLLVASSELVRFAARVWQAQPAATPELAHAPPLRPPLA